MRIAARKPREERGSDGVVNAIRVCDGELCLKCLTSLDILMIKSSGIKLRAHERHLKWGPVPHHYKN